MQSKRIDNVIASIKVRYERREIILNKFMEKAMDSGNFNDYEKIQKRLDEIDAAMRKEEKAVDAMYVQKIDETC